MFTIIAFLLEKYHKKRYSVGIGNKFQTRIEVADMRGKYEIDMTTGSLAPKIIKFTIPFMLSAMLQSFFNSADNAVIGAFDGSNALAAVASTGSITSFAVNLFLGFSVGTNVLVSNAIGAGNKTSCKKSVHTSVALSILIGIVLGILCFLLTRTFLTLLNCPDEVIDLADIYLKMYFIGMPALSVYNSGAAILRSMGDTRRPLVYLLIAGIVNVVLNLVLVIGFDMSTAGVGIATTVSQYLSATLIIITLMKEKSVCHLDIKELKISLPVVSKILRIGIPASVQGLMFSISNLSIQSAVNTFGANAMAGVGGASNINSLMYNSVSSFSHAALAFTGQNYGARKFDRIKKVYMWSNILMLMSWALFAIIVLPNAQFIIRIFLPTNDKAMEFAKISVYTLSTTYFIAGFMEVAIGMARGLGHSTVPAVVSVFGICGIRLVWLETIFKKVPTVSCLYISYPVTWFVTFVAVALYFVYVYKKLLKEHK